ncbi:unnamed protein product [Bursaphelenchus okinawaensis]|uniref:Peptidase_M13 domain-containing protein n=1 Tax=Bursaphelenchus okinawaensis TaxID=465554 RepID=A0A811KPX8_9BILA|nr:unnamed protein product [Bursaphelenchus okinawaensis]CAG9108315.1 unnamed protein product [Bursaphelenchus okinawaensis]
MNKVLIIKIVALTVVLAALAVLCYFLFEKDDFNKKKDEEVDKFEENLYEDVINRLNVTVDPCEDFYEYACGNWENQNPPPDGNSYWTGESKIAQQISDKILTAMLAVDVDESNSLKMAKTFFRTCIDNSTKDTNWLISLFNDGYLDGLHKKLPLDVLQFPLLSSEFKEVGSSVAARMGMFKSVLGVDTLLFPYVLESSLNSTRNVLWLSGDMLFLGMNIDNFLNEDKGRIQQAYKALQKEVVELLAKDLKYDVKIDQQQLNSLFEFEKELALIKSTVHDEDTEDELTLQEIIKQSPGFPWGDYLKELLGQPAVKLLKSEKRILFIAGKFVNKNDWMDNITKARALEKLQLVEDLIGYPDIVLNNTEIDEYYKDLKISSTSPFGHQNFLLKSWGLRQNLELLLKDTSRRYFRGSPVRTNAWYMAETNSITIPIGELDYPAVGTHHPNWALYGGLGALIGHELSHGFFDPNGAEYDGNGNLHNWWSSESKQEFKKKQQCLISQFNDYHDKQLNVSVDGKRTLSENAADLAGLKVTYQAYKSVNKNRKIKNFTDEQLFFLSYPLYFCASEMSESERRSDFKQSYSPLKYRVNGIVRNVPEFSKAFQCSETSYMNVKDRCVL